MTTPISELSANWPASAAASERQRAERVIAQLTEQPKGSEHTPSALSREDLVEPVQQINEVFGKHGIEFDVSDDANRLVVRIVDQQSGDVIRQIPAEEVLRVAERLHEAQGRLLNQEA